MYKTLASCVIGIVAAVIVGWLLWSTVQKEGARRPQTAGYVSNGAGDKRPVQAFTTTEKLADYLVAAAEHDSAGVDRICKSPDSVLLPAGTSVRILGLSGAGQARISVSGGPDRGKVLYVSFATIQEAAPK